MSAGGDFGNPLRKFKLVFLGEQSGECVAPPPLAAGRSVPAPTPVQPFRPRRLPARLAPRSLPPQPYPMCPPVPPAFCLDPSVEFLPSSPGSSILDSPSLFSAARPSPVDLPSLSSPHPAQPLVHPFLPPVSVVSPTPAFFLEPHPYSLPFSQFLGSVRPTQGSSTPESGPSSTLAKEGGIWALFSPEACP
ncbi:vegetative cell wall protein gp1-like [Cebus imitator]|uniref:vegetative cell wall protein gp1-like n=1 Tax=Cebus imitator TaxID=2715852 RepID=UPI00080A3918|nr:vegetative cell wall protein gp1-like [Cebus imitator]